MVVIGVLFVSSFLILICDVFDFVVKWRRRSKTSRPSYPSHTGYRTVRYDDAYKLDYNKYFMYIRQSLDDAYRRGDFDEPPKYNDNEKYNTHISRRRYYGRS